MKYVFLSFEQAITHANSEAYRTGIRQKVQSRSSVPHGTATLWSVAPIVTLQRGRYWPEPLNYVRVEAKKEGDRVVKMSSETPIDR